MPSSAAEAVWVAVLGLAAEVLVVGASTVDVVCRLVCVEVSEGVGVLASDTAVVSVDAVEVARAVASVPGTAIPLALMRGVARDVVAVDESSALPVSALEREVAWAEVVTAESVAELTVSIESMETTDPGVISTSTARSFPTEPSSDVREWVLIPSETIISSYRSKEPSLSESSYTVREHDVPVGTEASTVTSTLIAFSYQS